MTQKETIDLYNKFVKTQNQFNAIKRSKKFIHNGLVFYSAELQILGLLKSNSSLTITELAEELYMTKSAVSQLIKKIYSKDLIIKTRNIENERVVKLEITETGESVINRFLKNKHDELGLFLDAYSELDKMQYDTIWMFLSKLEKMFDRTLE